MHINVRQYGAIFLFLGFNLIASFAYAQSQSVAGVLSLSTGQANGDIVGFVRVDRLSPSNSFLGSVDTSVTIPDQQSSLSYNIPSVDSVPDGGSFRVRFVCQTNCGSLVPTSFYSTSGTVFSQGEASLISAEEDHTNINIALSNGNTLSGMFRLPNSEQAQAPLTFFISVVTFDAQGNTVNSNQSVMVDFAVGDSVKAFDSQVFAPQAGGSYRLLVRCFTDCGPYFNFFVLVDAGISYQLANGQQFAANTSHSNIEIEALRALSITGELSLQGDEEADRDLSYRITAFTEPDVGNGINNSETVTISQGSNSSMYTLLAGPAEAGEIIVSFRCQTDPDCEPYVSNGLYNEDGSLTGGSTPLDPTIDHSDIDIELSRGNSISGTLSLPTGINNGDDFQVSMQVSLRTDTGFTTLGVTDSVVIANGDSSADFSIIGLPVSPDGNYILSYVCGSCFGFVEQGFYNNGDSVLVLGDGSNFSAEVGQSHTGANFSLIPGNSFRGSVLLPEGTVAEQQTEAIQVIVDLYDFNDQLFRSRGDIFVIRQDDNSSEYLTPGLQTLAGGYYVLRLTCLANSTECLEPFEGLGFYTDEGVVEDLVDAQRFAADNASITSDGTTSDLDFQLIEIEQELCFPIAATNGNFAVVCL